jgi:hypothetical protein
VKIQIPQRRTQRDCISASAMFMLQHQTTVQKHCISVANKLFEMRHSANISQRRLTDHNCIHEEAKSSLNSGSAYYNVTQSVAFPADI